MIRITALVIGLLLAASAAAQNSTVIMDVNLIMSARGQPTPYDGIEYPVTFEARFDWDFTDAMLTPKEVASNFPSTFPTRLLQRDIMNELNKLGFTDNTGLYTMTLNGDQAGLSTLSINNFDPAVNLVEVEYFDPLIGVNFTSSWHGQSPNYTITQGPVVPEPSAAVLALLGICGVILHARSRRVGRQKRQVLLEAQPRDETS